MRFRRLIPSAALLASAAALPPHPAAEAVLPPAPKWDGASRRLALPPDHPWATPAERELFRHTPRYDETMAWLSRLAEASPRVTLVTIGRSPEGRAIVMAVASREGEATPEALRRSGRPTVLAQAGIHAGEIDGKDAGMMLLRDLTVGGRERALLEGANLLFVPIFNVDGHERFSRFGRVNQRGPEETGWRTTAKNLNLNRDYAKLDAPEMRALVRVLREWAPDLYLDLHVTDGADYQYDITFGWNGPHAHSPAIARWLDEVYRPAVSQALRREGHVPGPLVFPADGRDPSRGIVGWTASPRYSTGYGDARHLPTVLVENHSLKGYERRVLGTYVLLRETLRVAAEHGAELRESIAADRRRRRANVPLDWRVPDEKPPEIEFLGVSSREHLSPVTGTPVMEWTGRPVVLRVPYAIASEPAKSVSRPDAYWIPPAWTEVIDRLSWHGIRFERQVAPRRLRLAYYRLSAPELDERPFEGRVRVSAAVSVEVREETWPAGSVRVPTDQELGDLAVLLLEPESPDSLFRWGFFLPVLQRTEYIEPYVLEPLARAMLEEDPDLRAEFLRRLESDEAFRGDPAARLRFFYERTPYFDERYLLYPVAREPAGGEISRGSPASP
ncbi:MAG: carboxypeptidase [Acidobacteria bacterium]|nr:MAG: carboxypeptidase [Acidobacteriota bacterium]